MGHFPSLMGKKWGRNGEVFLSCISAIRQRVDHRDLLFELSDMILYHEKSLIQGRIPAERRKKLPDAPHAPDRDMLSDMAVRVT